MPMDRVRNLLVLAELHSFLHHESEVHAYLGFSPQVFLYFIPPRIGASRRAVSRGTYDLNVDNEPGVRAFSGNRVSYTVFSLST